MGELLNQTEAYCPDCRTIHQARQLREGDRIIGVVECPQGKREVLLSGEAELFLKFRRQADFDPGFQPPEGYPFFFHHLSITDYCDCSCPVCYADSGSKEESSHLHLDAVRAMASIARSNKVQTIILVGGEPTAHPDLVEIVRILRKARFRVWMATNGLRIAREPELAKALRRAGLEKISLQLDSFDPESHSAIRGHDNIAAKIAAARIIVDAGLQLGIICTVTSHNIAELSSFCRQLLAWPSPPHNILFQGAAHVGRFAIADEEQISRETIISSLVTGGAVPALTAADFWPIPLFRPQHIYVHPDCAANTFVLLTHRGVEPVSKYVDMDRCIITISRTDIQTQGWALRWRLLLIVLRCLRPKGWLMGTRHIMSRLVAGPGVRVILIGTGAFLRSEFLDMARVRRCGSGTLSSAGCESLCAFHSKRCCNAT